MFKKFEIFIHSAIESSLQRKIILIATLIAFILSVLMIAPSKLVLAKMLPGKNNDTFNIYVTLKSGSSIAQTQEVTQCVSSILTQEKELRDLEVFLGMGSPLDFAGLIKGSHFKNSENVAEIVLNLTKKHDRDEPSYLMVQRLRPIVQSQCQKLYEGTKISFVEPPAGPPTMAAVVAEIYGDNAEGIRKLSQRVADVFSKTDGLVDIDIMQDDIFDTYKIVVNNTKIVRSGVDIEQLNNIIYLAFEGMQIAVKNSEVYNDQVPIYLVLSKESKSFTKKDLDSIKVKLSALKLMNNQGMMIPLT
ncbi:MAG: efflux RND transporter permease subunit, partial [Sulfurimonas sp.]|nr:efflux RND transporter permease subunit [Sulfurimonas sp.]